MQHVDDEAAGSSAYCWLDSTNFAALLKHFMDYLYLMFIGDEGK